MILYTLPQIHTVIPTLISGLPLLAYRQFTYDLLLPKAASRQVDMQDLTTSRKEALNEGC